MPRARLNIALGTLLALSTCVGAAGDTSNSTNLLTPVFPGLEIPTNQPALDCTSTAMVGDTNCILEVNKQKLEAIGQVKAIAGKIGEGCKMPSEGVIGVGMGSARLNLSWAAACMGADQNCRSTCKASAETLEGELKATEAALASCGPECPQHGVLEEQKDTLVSDIKIVQTTSQKCGEVYGGRRVALESEAQTAAAAASKAGDTNAACKSTLAKVGEFISNHKEALVVGAAGVGAGLLMGSKMTGDEKKEKGGNKNQNPVDATATGGENAAQSPEAWYKAQAAKYCKKSAKAACYSCQSQNGGSQDLAAYRDLTQCQDDPAYANPAVVQIQPNTPVESGPPMTLPNTTASAGTTATNLPRTTAAVRAQTPLSGGSARAGQGQGESAGVGSDIGTRYGPSVFTSSSRAIQYMCSRGELNNCGTRRY